MHGVYALFSLCSLKMYVCAGITTPFYPSPLKQAYSLLMPNQGQTGEGGKSIFDISDFAYVQCLKPQNCKASIRLSTPVIIVNNRLDFQLLQLSIIFVDLSI